MPYAIPDSVPAVVDIEARNSMVRTIRADIQEITHMDRAAKAQGRVVVFGGMPELSPIHPGILGAQLRECAAAVQACAGPSFLSLDDSAKVAGLSGDYIRYIPPFPRFVLSLEAALRITSKELATAPPTVLSLVALRCAKALVGVPDMVKSTGILRACVLCEQEILRGAAFWVAAGNLVDASLAGALAQVLSEAAKMASLVKEALRAQRYGDMVQAFREEAVSK